MKTADCILREVTEVSDFFDGMEIVEGDVTWNQAITAMERYADQFKSSPIEAVEVVNPANQEWDDRLYLEAYETYGSELANLPPKVVRKEKSDQSDSELTNT